MDGEDSEPTLHVAILGHVDVGKTELVRALGECEHVQATHSTASLDRHPESQRRGITLDLGFSSISFPQGSFRLCLIDAPGHASLLRSIVAAASLMDICLLVVDASVGPQLQTAECLVLAELFAKQSIVVLNKVDKIPEEIRETKISALKTRLRSFLRTRFSFEDVPIICECSSKERDVEQLLGALRDSALALIPHLNRKDVSPFLASMDHHFYANGKGTIVTASILQGKLTPGCDVAFLKAQKQGKIRSMQVFKQSVNEARAGSRVALCTVGADLKHASNRDMLCIAGCPQIQSRMTLTFVASKIRRISIYKAAIASRSSLTICMGSFCVPARVFLFRLSKPVSTVSEILALSGEEDIAIPHSFPPRLPGDAQEDDRDAVLAVIHSTSGPVLALEESRLVAMQSDASAPENSQSPCRLAFTGIVLGPVYTKEDAGLLERLISRPKRVVRTRLGKGVVKGDSSLVVTGLFDSLAHVQAFINHPVRLRYMDEDEGVIGHVSRPFGKAGKCTVTAAAALKKDEKYSVQLSILKKTTNSGVVTGSGY